MKTKLISLGLLFIIISCNTQQNEDKATLDSDEKSEIESESSVVYDSSEAIWGYEFNQQTGINELKQLRSVDKNILTGEIIEKIINQSWPRVEIKFIKTSSDTAFISIPDSKVMTQQMGSAGAESFMVSTTYTFTELEGINHVMFDFEEGDHARPGVYDRNSWDGYSGPETEKPINKSEPLSVSTIQIGEQIWMAENLSVRHYQNGESIAFAETAEDLERFGNAEIGAWMYPNGDSSLVAEYGLLYNWFAVMDERGLAPEGWHVPSDDDWQQLAEHLGVDSAGLQLKVPEGWMDEGGGTNSSGFSAIPAGFRHWDGTYEGLGIYGSWWTTTVLEDDSYYVWFRGVGHDYDHLYRDRTSKYLGMSLRMIRK